MRTRYQVLLHLVVITVIALIALAPVLAAIGAGTFANMHGCRLDEGSVHPCVVAGHDYGDALYQLGVMGWFALVTVPLGAVLFVVYVVVSVVIYLVTGARRRRTVAS